MELKHVGTFQGVEDASPGFAPRPRSEETRVPVHLDRKIAMVLDYFLPMGVDDRLARWNKNTEWLPLIKVYAGADEKNAMIGGKHLGKCRDR